MNSMDVYSQSVGKDKPGVMNLEWFELTNERKDIHPVYKELYIEIKKGIISKGANFGPAGTIYIIILEYAKGSH